MDRLKILYPHPALKLTKAGKDYLIISDLHIGFEQRFNTEGFKIPASTDKMLQTLIELIRLHEPDRLLILGDVKSGFSRVSRATTPSARSSLRKSSVPLTVVFSCSWSTAPPKCVGAWIMR